MNRLKQANQHDYQIFKNPAIGKQQKKTCIALVILKLDTMIY